MKRIRKTDVEKMNKDTLEALRQKLVDKVTKINDDAVKKANKLLNTYGLEAKMQIVLQPKENNNL